ncbi:hypothetical protein NC651_034394 [Populus alba x Populus x berolinensis]|nr:hypothetical protein NC651_034394 [Populus alba x Populus x berolinensis]
MASTSSTPSDPSISLHEDTAIRAVNKRYEGLITVKTKAIKGSFYEMFDVPVDIRSLADLGFGMTAKKP